jgi:hypothetical protein
VTTTTPCFAIFVPLVHQRGGFKLRAAATKRGRVTHTAPGLRRLRPFEAQLAQWWLGVGNSAKATHRPIRAPDAGQRTGVHAQLGRSQGAGLGIPSGWAGTGISCNIWRRHVLVRIRPRVLAASERHEREQGKAEH